MDRNKSQPNLTFLLDHHVQSDIYNNLKVSSRHTHVERISNSTDCEDSQRHYYNVKHKYAQIKVKRTNLFPSARTKAFKPKLICLKKESHAVNTPRLRTNQIHWDVSPTPQKTGRKIRFAGIDSEESLSPNSKKYVDSVFEEFSQKQIGE